MTIKINEIFAKDDKTTLIEHSKKVSDVAVRIAKNILLEDNPDLIEIVRISSLLHDTGKCTLQFQKKLKNVNFETIEMEDKMPYRHNEVGWAFLNRYLKSFPNKDVIIDSVYWHHGITNKFCGYNDTDIKLSNSDVEVMKEFVSYILGPEFLIENPPYRPVKAPAFYHPYGLEDKNMTNLFVRYCLTYADKMVSKHMNLSTDEIIKLSVEETATNKKIDLSQHIYAGNERFIEQVRIANSCEHTTCINATAGYGKSLLTLLWWAKSGEKLIWVCPKNNVAENVYNTIIRELSNAGVTNVSVELFLGGETKKHNSNFVEEFSSDIIITNIDNFLRPTVDNSDSSRLHSIMTYNVVFDEYHELISDVALYAGFINVMKIRHNLINKKTILISATHELIYKMWERDLPGSIKTTHLPGEFKHYNAIHQKQYTINTFDSMPTLPKENSLIISNSIRQSQQITYQTGSDILIHSKFQEDDRNALLNKIHAIYGKNSDTSEVRPLVVAAPLLQASYDLSFPNIFECALSPGATMQRCTGRCNRFGDLDGCTINIYDTTNPSEVSSIKNMYDYNLTRKWFRYISQYNKKKLTPDELYVIYNNYMRENQDELYQMLVDRYVRSLDKMSMIYPIKRKNLQKSDIKIAGSNKLRQSGYNEVFITCPTQENNKKYINPFSVSIYADTFEEEFDELKLGNVYNQQKKIMSNILFNDSRFDFKRILELDKKKKMSLGMYRIDAKASNTPYIVFNMTYHKKYGIILNKVLKNLCI